MPLRGVERWGGQAIVFISQKLTTTNQQLIKN